METIYQDEDFCYLCAPDKQRAGKSPNLLVTLSEPTNNDILVKVCPECDGDAAVLGLR